MVSSADRNVEAEKLQFLKDQFWLCSALCVGNGIKGPTPIYDHKRKFLCLRWEGNSNEECMGELGLCAGLQKTFCCINMAEFPPDPLMLACCGKFLVGQPPVAAVRGASPEQAEQMSFVKDTFWLWYCCCQGIGLTSPMEPSMIKGTSKFFCLRDNCETDDIMGTPGTTDSFAYQYQSCCCFSTYCQLLPAMEMTPGIACCNQSCGMQNLGNAREALLVDPQTGNPIQNEMSVMSQ